jgi:hypothetical protein
MKPLILVGMNQRTRHLIPWDSDTEIWTLNEAYVNKWMKRYDVLFQLHPRWDWERPNNMADPNHPNYIKALSVEGEYVLPPERIGKTIVMQDMNEDVPGCEVLPITRMKKFCYGGVPYFTSTFAHMLVYAFYFDYTDISIYGFGMESDTEYAHQRACAEYWIGYGRALGIKIEAPGANILKGEHYAYSSNWQGYRTRLDLRKQHLQQQLQIAEGEAIKSEGALNAITPFKAIPEVTPAFDQHFDEHFKRKGFVSFLRGTIREIDNAIAIYDAYYVDGKGEPPDVGKLLQLTYELG